ncbi:MAG: protein kinase [Defluviitaleaceae bacterium]|nr:protein kinase [Defluviitaleaceae bacterium]
MLKVNGKILCPSCFAEYQHERFSCDVCGYAEGAADESKERAGALPIGAALSGRYSVGMTLGRGEYGITYLAYDVPADMPVVIKEYFPAALAYRLPGSPLVLSASGETQLLFKNGADKFYEEAKNLKRFGENPGVVRVLRQFYENNTAYYSMEYLEGLDLRRYVKARGGKLTYTEVLRIAESVLSVLTIVHCINIVHGNIAPENIFITSRNSIKLMDFGGAKRGLAEEAGAPQIFLKPGFAAPEQYKKSSGRGPWTDIYALGATMYFCLTGIVPEDAPSRAKKDALVPPDKLGLGVPATFEKVIMKMMSVKRERRYQDVHQVRNSISLIMAGKAGLEKYIGFGDFMRKHGLNFSLAAAVIVVILSVTAIMSANKQVLSASADDPAPALQAGVAAPSATPKPASASATDMNYVYEDGQKVSYTGDLLDGKPDGVGKMAWLNGQIYQGGFKDGLFDGHGVMTWPSGASYDGDWAAGLKDGQGTYTYSNGDVYTGSYKNNKINGEGSYAYNGGDVYTGQFVDGARSGKGVMVYKSAGYTYDGDWVNGMWNGHGVITYTDGRKYDGAVADNKWDGNGTYTYADGTTYTGGFKDDKFDGQGVKKDAQGNVLQQGIWSQGKYIGPAPEASASPSPGAATETPASTTETATAAPTETATATPTETASPTSSPTKTPTATPPPTETPTATPSPTKAPTATPSPTPNASASPSPQDGTVNNQKYTYGGTEVTYSGGWKNNRPEGRGVMLWPNGDKYDGNFTNGRASGQGTMTWANGNKYEGNWADGNMDGSGVMHYADGRVYDGAWVQSTRQGKGKMLYANTDTYDGDWANNLKQGSGIYVSVAKGFTYTGDWANDMMDGQGTMLWSNGQKYVGGWKANMENGYGVLTGPDGSVMYQGNFVDNNFVGE